MATIGQTLSAARIAAGCSLENLSTRTRIRIQVLRGIENEDFVPCGGDFYARGHIRRICKLLGLDAAPLLEEYDREHASSETPTFIPLPRHPSAKSKTARMAAWGERSHTGAADHEASQGVPRSIGDEDTDPSQGAESWGHFERNQKLARRPRGNGPRPTSGVPEPRRVARHRKPDDPGPAQAGAGPWAAPRAATRPALTKTRTRRGERVRRHWPWAVVGLIVITAVFVGVRAWQGWDDGNPVRTAFDTVRDSGNETVDSSVQPSGSGAGTEGSGEGGAGEDGADEAQDARQKAEKAVAEARALAAPEEFTVALSASDRSWIRVSDPAGEDVFTGFLLQGEARDFVTEEPMTLWVGNAGAIEVAVDGEDLGPSGGLGEVREITVGADGFDD